MIGLYPRLLGPRHQAAFLPSVSQVLMQRSEYCDKTQSEMSIDALDVIVITDMARSMCFGPY